ncbi:hypothetical protein J7K44_02665 [bacterium]|nr:hypothetical protein [bacterium]
MKKIIQKIPFTVRIYLLLDTWAILCGLFGLFFILSRMSPESPQIERAFIFIILGLITASAILAPAEYGLLRPLGIKGKKEAQILNNNIVGNSINPDVTDETLKQIFFSLCQRPLGGIISSLKYAGGTTIFATLGAYLIGAKPINVIIIFIGGFIGTALLTVFANFFVERSVSPALKECQRMLKERGLKVERKPSTTLRSRFNYFIILFLLSFVILFSFIPHLSLSIIGVGLVSLIMVIVVSKVLFSSIYDIFLDIENFAKKLPKRERAFYLTGNLTKESMNLSKSLNETADELYEVREKTLKQAVELKRAYENIKKQKEDLEKFYKLTIGRELRMIELKKEIKKLERKLKKRERNKGELKELKKLKE